MNRIAGVAAIFLIAIGASIWCCAANAADQSPPPLTAKAKPIADIPFFFVNDNRLTYSHQFNAADAGAYTVGPNGTINGNQQYDIYAFTHFDVWAYGTNYVNVGLYKAGKNDPSAPCTSTGFITDSLGTVAASCAGVSDIYGLLRSTFGFNQIFDTHMFTAGPLQNISFEIGGDVDSSNSVFAGQKQMFVAGLQFAFELPYKGFFNVAPLYKHEHNHNGYSQCGYVFASAPPMCSSDGDITFKDTWALEINYTLPLGFLPESMQFWMISGRAGWYGPKGPLKGIAGFEHTKTEINAEPIRLTFDASKAIWGPKLSHELDLWAAYRYTKNQYGDDADSDPYICTLPVVTGSVSTNSCSSSSYALGATVKF